MIRERQDGNHRLNSLLTDRQEEDSGYTKKNDYSKDDKIKDNTSKPLFYLSVGVLLFYFSYSFYQSSVSTSTSPIQQHSQSSSASLYPVISTPGSMSSLKGDDLIHKIYDEKQIRRLDVFDKEKNKFTENNREIRTEKDMSVRMTVKDEEALQMDRTEAELMDQNIEEKISSATNIMFNDLPKNKVKVLIWSKVAGFIDWLRDDFTSAAKTMCPNVECVLTSNRNELQSVDAVFFHGPTHSPSDWPKSKPLVSEKFRSLKNGNRNPRIGQPIPYIFFTLEQPFYVKNLLPPHGDQVRRYASHFDYTMHYNLDATIHVTTIHPHYTAEDFFRQPKHWKSFNEKDGYGESNAVVAFVSNCKNAGATERLTFMKDLSKYIPLHSYGKCLHNKDEPRLKNGETRTDSKQKILSRYKFYLAFENRIIQDYVSEKVFDGLLSGSLPVYWGTSSVDAYLPHPKSIIKASDFDTPEALAQYLQKVANDEDLYNSYFEWKKTYDPQDPNIFNFQMKLNSTAYKYTSICNMCDAVANGEPAQDFTTKDLISYISV